MTATRPDLAALVARAGARRDAGDWAGALPLFAQAAELAPADAVLRHNLAMGHHALGRHHDAARHAEAAMQRNPALWQSGVLAARSRLALGDPVAADRLLAAVLARDPGNAMALLDRAGLLLNSFADPAAARASVTPLLSDPAHRADAELATLMADLYDRAGDDPMGFSDRLRRFSKAYLRTPPIGAAARRRAPSTRLRIGLVSPLFSRSPVYFLCWSALAALASTHDLILFDRGTRADGATARFQGLASEWHGVAHHDAAMLARAFDAAGLDAMIDLGGWADPVGLSALSALAHVPVWSWVGGQSATTGLDGLAGWIGDDAHLPPGAEALYSEPLVRMPGGYVDYTAPDGLAAIRAGAEGRQRGVGLVGNPAKIGAATLACWPAGVDRVTLIDRRYAHAPVRDRVTALLASAGIAVEAVVVVDGHDAYLRALAGLAAIVVTAPYSAGLTAVEALALGVRLIGGRPDAALFAGRHHLSHARTAGRNPALPQQLCTLIEAGTGFPCR